MVISSIAAPVTANSRCPAPPSLITADARASDTLGDQSLFVLGPNGSRTTCCGHGIARTAQYDAAVPLDDEPSYGLKDTATKARWHYRRTKECAFIQYTSLSKRFE